MKIYLNFILILCMYYKEPIEFVMRNKNCVSAIKTNQRMLYGEIIALC
jgi:hypothetical protein